MAYTSVLWPVICALHQATLFVGLHNHWMPQNDAQINFLARFYTPLVKQLGLFEKQELTAYAGDNIAELNRILRARGFDVQLQEYSDDPGAFGTIAILDIKETWPKPGTGIQLEHRITHTQYPAVSMEDDFQIYHTAIHPHPLVCLRTNTSDTVWLTVADQVRGDFELLDYVRQLRTNQKVLDYSYAKIIFPKIRYKQTTQLSWLRGLRLGIDHIIDQALVQTTFTLDERGAQVKSAAAIGIGTTCLHKTLTIDQPFFVWIEREGLHEPILAGYMPEQYWKE